MSTGLIVWSINLGIIITVGLGILVGLMRGFRKSLVFLILTVIWYTLAIILIPIISRSLLGANVSFLSNLLPDDIGEITSIKESLPIILQNSMPNQAHLFVAGSDLLEIIYGVFVLIINIILLIVFVVLHGTVFRIINSIIWLFFKPKRKEDGKKPNKHRLFGALIGGVKAFLVVMLLAIPTAGLFSITDSAFTFAKAAGGDDFELFADTEELDFYKGYRNSILGKTFGLFKNENDDYLDERLFDGFFNVEARFEDQTQKLRIRKDISNLASVYEKIIDVNGSSDIDESIIYKFEEDDLNYLKNKIVSMDLFKFINVVGGEFAYDYLVENDLIEGYETLLTKQNLKNIDLAKDLDKLITILITLNGYDYSNIEQNIFMFSEDEIEEVLDLLVEVELLKYGLPVAVNLLFNSEEMKQTLEDNNFDINDIVKPSYQDLLDDINNFKNVYKALKSFGLESFDGIENILEDPEFEVSENSIEMLIDAIFDFQLIDKNLEVISYYIYDEAFKGEENDFNDLFDKQTFVDNFNSNELTHIILAVLEISKSGALKEDGEITDLLTDDSIDKLAYHISNSELLSKAFEGLLNMLVEDESELSFEIPQNVTFKGASGEAEIKALFKAIKVIFSGDFDFLEANETEFEELAETLTNSKVIAHNLTKMLKQMFEGEDLLGIELTMPEIDLYGNPGKQELIALYRLINEVKDGDLLGAGVFDMDEDEIDDFVDLLTDSQIVAYNLKPIIQGLLDGESGTIDSGLTIPESVTFEGPEGKQELKALFVGLKAAKDLATFNYSTIDDSTKDDIKDTFKSINESVILRPLLVKIADGDGVVSVEDYRYQEGDPNYHDPKTLTKAEWDNEIDVLVDIIVILNTGFDLDDPQPDPSYAAKYAEIVVLMTGSLLYDETTLPTFP